MENNRLNAIRKILNWTETQELGWVELSPQAAEQLLQYNTKNRPVLYPRVTSLCKQIENGDWVPTQDAISFDETGILTNGQHRLLAIAKATKTCKVLITFGVKQSLILDTGRRRTLVQNAALSDDCAESLKSDKVVINMVSALVRYYSGGRHYSPIDYVKLMNKLEPELLLFRQEVIPNIGSEKNISIAAVHVPLFVAMMNGVRPCVLARIYDILKSGIVEDPVYDAPLITARDALKEMKGIGNDVLKHKVSIVSECIHCIENKKKRGSFRGLTEPKYSFDIHEYIA